MTALLIRDELMGSDTFREFTMEMETESTTVRELIRSRIYQEVQDYNMGSSQLEFQGLVKPTDAERILNGQRVTEKKQIDWNAQFERAVKAFEENRILILVDDQQVTSLEERIGLGPQTVVTFMRLTLLIGG